MPPLELLVACALVAVPLLTSGCGREVGDECEILTGDDVSEVIVETRNWHCESEICVGTSESAYCSGRCETDADCRVGMHCEDLSWDALIHGWICMED